MATNPWNLLIEAPLWRPGQALNEEQSAVWREAREDKNVTCWGKPVRRRRSDLPFGLSPKQLLIVRYMIEGNGYDEIAAALNMSVKTISEHITRACQKAEAIYPDGRTNKLRLCVLVDRLIRGDSNPPKMSAATRVGLRATV